MLRYLYTDRTDMKSIEEAWQLYYAANKYVLPGLQEMCIQYIIRVLSLSNVCLVYELARFDELQDLKELKEKCLEMMYLDTEAVLGDEAFLEAEVQTVVDIFSLNQLNISSEVVLLKAIEKYAAHNQLTGPSIHRILHKIRFLSLTFHEFIDNVHSTTLLSGQDKYDLLLNIAYPQTNFAIPEGFSTNRERR